MFMRTVMVAAVAFGIAGPTFAQDQIRVTAQQCVDAGGTINQATNRCEIADANQLAGLQENAGLGTGVGGGGAIAAGLLIVVLAATGGSSATTTTTGASGG